MEVKLDALGLVIWCSYIYEKKIISNQFEVNWLLVGIQILICLCQNIRSKISNKHPQMCKMNSI